MCIMIVVWCVYHGCAGMVLIMVRNGWGRCGWVHVLGYGSSGVVECVVVVCV